MSWSDFGVEPRDHGPVEKAEIPDLCHQDHDLTESDPCSENHIESPISSTVDRLEKRLFEKFES
jgi:hypothetical protein